MKVVYHIHLIENTGFLEDLFCQIKPFRPFLREKIDKENPLGSLVQPKGQAKVPTEIQGDHLYELSQYWNPQWSFINGIWRERMQVRDVIFQGKNLANKPLSLFFCQNKGSPRERQ